MNNLGQTTIKGARMKRGSIIAAVCVCWIGLTVPTETYAENRAQCFWMENTSGENRWVDAERVQQRALNEEDCFELDSCNGGKGASGGGCYKWAVSAEAPRLSWSGAAPTAENRTQCFWMENTSGENRWIDAESVQQRALSEADCFELDSCNGGKGASGGGCYKWAVSAEAPRLSWNGAAPTKAPQAPHVSPKVIASVANIPIKDSTALSAKRHIDKVEPLIWPKKVDAVAKSYNCSQPTNFYATNKTFKAPFSFDGNNHLVFWCQDKSTGEHKLIQHSFDPKSDYFPGCSKVIDIDEENLGGVSFNHVWSHDAKLYYDENKISGISELYVIQSEFFTAGERPRLAATGGRYSYDVLVEWVCINKEWVKRPAISMGDYIPW